MWWEFLKKDHNFIINYCRFYGVRLCVYLNSSIKTVMNKPANGQVQKKYYFTSV